MTGQSERCRVVIVGGGFAGLCATGILSEGKIAAPQIETLRDVYAPPGARRQF